MIKYGSRIIVFVFLAFFALSADSQNPATMDSLQKAYQSCLDLGQDMTGCSRTYYARMDSMLNVVYEKVISLSGSVKRKQVSGQQKVWLTKRDAYFTKEEAKYGNDKSPGGLSRESRMMIMDAKAVFVEKRTRQLIRAFPSFFQL
jgi:uncharacterized protein YecT (DUF1311 family)